MKEIFRLMGAYLVLDGIASILVFRDQPLAYQIPRIIRAGIGFALLKC